jgi:hypothetical protein
MLLIMAAILAATAPEPALPVWMAGCWERSEGAKWTEECWTDPRAGLMMGNGSSGTGEKLGSWEAMQIEIDPADPAGMTFYASPKGAPRTAFKWVPSDEKGVTFVNEAHDYPQRIRYWREGMALNAETSLIDGSSAERWRYMPKSE